MKRTIEMHRISAPIEVQAVNEDERTFEGVAATWNVNLKGLRIQRGAWKRTLDHLTGGEGIPLIDDHGFLQGVRSAVGRMVSGRESDEGLIAKFSVLKSTDGDEIWARVTQKIVTKLSVGFEVLRESKETPEGQRDPIRVIEEARLAEVSLVLWPADPGAHIRQALRVLSEAGAQEIDRADIEIVHQGLGALLVGPGLAPEDEERRKVEAAIRDLELRSLATR